MPKLELGRCEGGKMPVLVVLSGEGDRVTLVFEAIGGDKVRLECSSWDSSRVTLAHEALQAVALGKTLM